MDQYPGGGVGADPGNRKWDAGSFVVEVEPFLVKAAMGAQQLAVVRGTHDHRVFRSSIGYGSTHPINWAIYFCV